MDWEIEIGGVLTKQEQAKKKEMMDGSQWKEMTDCVKSSIGNRCITTNDLLREIFICQNHIVCTQIICSWCQKHPETKQS